MQGAHLTAGDSALAQLCVDAAVLVGEASIGLDAARMTLCPCRGGRLVDARKNSGEAAMRATPGAEPALNASRPALVSSERRR
jgi:hypothetical protein